MAAKKRKPMGKKSGRKKSKKNLAKPAAPAHELARLNKWYSMQLEEKDNTIKKLRDENAVLLATALKQSQKTRDIFERAEKAMEKKKRHG